MTADPLKMILDVITMLLGSSVMATIVVAIFERKNKQAIAKKTEAEYADQISKTALSLMTPLKDEVGRLTSRVNRLERQIGRYAQRVVYLMGGIDQLIRQINNLGKSPDWSPDNWDPDDCEDPQ